MIAWLLLGCIAGAPPRGLAGDSAAGDSAAGDSAALGPFTQQRFEAAALGLDVSRPVGYGGPGVAIGDLDGDGDADLAWVSPRGWGLSLRGDGEGGFEPWESLPGGSGVSAADPDGDGDLDLLVLGPGEDTLLWNDGSGTFLAAPLEAGAERESHSASWSDLDSDGDLDLFVATYLSDLNGELILSSGGAGDGNRLYLNRGGVLEPADALLDDAARDGLSFHGAWLDVDLDGDRDLYIVNDFGPAATPNQLLRNDGGVLVNASEDCGCALAMFAMGVAVGDPDGDGDPDLFVTDLGPPEYLANHGGTFVNSGLAEGLIPPDDAVHDTSWGALFVDLDLDGWEDLAVTYGQLGAPGTQMADWLLEHQDVVFEDAAAQPDVLLHSQAGQGWLEVAAAVGFDDPGVTRSVAAGDLDGDGQPELVTVGLDYLAIYDPAPTTHRSLVITLDAGGMNRFGLGARVEVSAGGRTRTRWMQPTAQGSFSSSAPEVIVGLGEAERADVAVIWPDGARTERAAVPAGRLHLRR